MVSTRRSVFHNLKPLTTKKGEFSCKLSQHAEASFTILNGNPMDPQTLYALSLNTPKRLSQS